MSEKRGFNLEDSLIKNLLEDSNKENYLDKEKFSKRVYSLVQKSIGNMSITEYCESIDRLYDKFRFLYNEQKLRKT